MSESVIIKIDEQQSRRIRLHVHKKGLSQALYVGLLLTKYIYDEKIREKCRRHLWINQYELIGDRRHLMTLYLNKMLKEKAREVAGDLGIKRTTLILKLIMMEMEGKVDFKI